MERELSDLAVSVIRHLEWSAQTQGPGSSMGRGDGRWVPSCPMCRGIKPGKAGADFYKDAEGHRAECSIGRVLAGVDLTRPEVSSPA